MNPDTIALMQEMTRKLEAMAKAREEDRIRMDNLEKEVQHDRALKAQRKELIQTFTA